MQTPFRADILYGWSLSKSCISSQVAGQLLNPVGSEFTATFVGRLVTTLIQRTGDRLGENLDLLLKAVLSKLQGSQTLSVIQVGCIHMCLG